MQFETVICMWQDYFMARLRVLERVLCNLYILFVFPLFFSAVGKTWLVVTT